MRNDEENVRCSLMNLRLLRFVFYRKRKIFFVLISVRRTQHVRIKQKDITEDRLPVMCAALWKRFQYTLRPPSAWHFFTYFFYWKKKNLPIRSEERIFCREKPKISLLVQMIDENRWESSANAFFSRSFSFYSLFNFLRLCLSSFWH